MLDFDYSRDARLKELGRVVSFNPEDHEAWKELLEKLISQDGRLNRGSDPAEIAGFRAGYNHNLALYPLSQETWIQYADMEFRIAGTESAQHIYERAVGSCSGSVDIWSKYCDHMLTTSHNTVVIKELFDRAMESAGHDFYSDALWDAYLQFMNRHSNTADIFEVYQRLITIPLFHYARYFNDFRGIMAQLPPEAIEAPEVLLSLQAEVQKELPDGSPADMLAAVRNKVDQRYWESFQRLQEDVNNRWQWEQHLQKDGGAKLDEQTRLNMWTEYLDYEEKRGDYVGIRALYERCLMFNSTQMPFWYRYVRWLTAQPDKEEETRNVFRRASYIFAEIYDPTVRLAWAKFEEASGRLGVAADIYEAVLEDLPDDVSTNTALTMLYRRQQGLEAAVTSLAARIANLKASLNTRGALVGDYAKLVWRETGDANAARQIFVQHQQNMADAATFWSGWLTFELDQPLQREKAQGDRARSIYQSMQQMANLPAQDLQQLATLYMRYLDERADAGAIAELVEIDAFVNGPASVRSTLGAGNAVPTTNGQSK